jgi:hypothetical protein
MSLRKSTFNPLKASWMRCIAWDMTVSVASDRGELPRIPPAQLLESREPSPGEMRKILLALGISRSLT